MKILFKILKNQFFDFSLTYFKNLVKCSSWYFKKSTSCSLFLASTSFLSLFLLSIASIFDLSSETLFSSLVFLCSNSSMVFSKSAFPCSAWSYFLMAKVTELWYKVWYAAMVILISSLTLRRSNPLSGSLSVTCLMISSKHWEKSSSRTGHIPLSLACLSISFWSSISLSLATSTLEAGWWLTYWMKCFPVSTHSLGGKMAFKISSELGFVSKAGRCDFFVPIVEKI